MPWEMREMDQPSEQCCLMFGERRSDHRNRSSANPFRHHSFHHQGSTTCTDSVGDVWFCAVPRPSGDLEVMGEYI